MSKDQDPQALQPASYGALVGDIGELLDAARRTTVRTVNSIMTATYWQIGRRIVEFEQGGEARAEYGKQLLKRLSVDLTAEFGRGFSPANLERFRLFYRRFPAPSISATPSQTLRTTTEPAQGICSTPSQKLETATLATTFPLPWSHYALLVRARSPEAVAFYHAEALRGGWSVRQLKRQIDSQFYERTALSKNKAAMLSKGQQVRPDDFVTVEAQLKDPLVLEFLNLKDEYAERDLEDGLVRHLEAFLLELGGDFTFVERQRRLRIDDEWFRIDLLFFHRRLRCLVIIDLKLGTFRHADAGQMNVYLNYAREHWTHEDENPPVGIILCAAKGESLVRYATEGLKEKMLVQRYLMTLPDEQVLADELERVRRRLEEHA